MAHLAQPYLTPVDAAPSCYLIATRTPGLLRRYFITHMKTLCIRKRAVFLCEEPR